jgi:hypothetical protein
VQTVRRLTDQIRSAAARASERYRHADRNRQFAVDGVGNSSRSRLYLERVKDDRDARTPNTKKFNYGPPDGDGDIPLRWRDGVFVCEDRSAPNGEGAAGRARLPDARRSVRQGRPVSASKGANYAPAVFAQDQRAEGLSCKVLQTAANSLLASRRIRSETFGPPSRQSARLVVS